MNSTFEVGDRIVWIYNDGKRPEGVITDICDREVKVDWDDIGWATHGIRTIEEQARKVIPKPKRNR